MNDFRADLHCHSTYSDGTCTPQELLNLAKEKKLSALSITDHDNVDAYHTLVPVKDTLGLYRSNDPNVDIVILSGIEFSTTFLNESVHVLGYRFDISSPYITNLCLKHKNRRKIRNQKMLVLLEKYGMPITEEEISDNFSKGAIGRPHIALAMIKRGYIKTIKEGFEKYLGDGRCCYVQGETLSLQETIDSIHAASGVAIIAHPHLIKLQQLLKETLKQPFDGLECYYGNFHPHAHEKWLVHAKKKGWLVTGGSDFHGDNKPGLNLGASWVDQDRFNAILNHPR